MSSHVYHEIYLHLNWHVKDDQPVLNSKLEPIVHQIITDRIHRTNGVWLHGINGTETHIHVAINIEPHICISELVKELKGGSSFETNQKQGSKVLEWQRGYGVVSFGKNNLPWVLEYIANQKEHHSKGRVHDRLERADEDEGP
ncbi:MAG: transposase IS200-family protein [Planctomycetota bacterium]|nr:MAG: transposase IS200-family protein [Planctomycetota bacterium]